jgi:hypothetical protein
MEMGGGEMNEIELAGVTLVFDHNATLVAIEIGSGWHTLVGSDMDAVEAYLGDRAPLGIRGEVTLTDFLCALA